MILFSHVLQLLAGVRDNDDSGTDLPGKFRELFVTLLNLLVKGLVLDLELLEIDQVETVSQLLLLLEYLFAVSKLITELNVLESVLMYFRVFGLVSSFPVVNHAGAEGLVGATEHGVLGDRALQLLELVLDLFALSLLLIELGLKFGSHSVVTLLGLFQVEADLMDVS